MCRLLALHTAPHQRLRLEHAGQHYEVVWWRKVGYRGAEVLDWDAYPRLSGVPVVTFPVGLYEAIWNAVSDAAARWDEGARVNNRAASTPEPAI